MILSHGHGWYLSYANALECAEAAIAVALEQGAPLSIGAVYSDETALVVADPTGHLGVRLYVLHGRHCPAETELTELITYFLHHGADIHPPINGV